MNIDTGKGGTIGLCAMLGIWSVSALTSLPGLAISPILGDIKKIFEQATDFDVQMLTSLPSLLIIPFILLAGRLTNVIGYMRLLYLGLWVFLFSGVLYFFCNTIDELILVSLLLGVGAGIITPLSTSLVSRFFLGEQRTKQFGYSSAINNLALVLATALTGYLAEFEWRLPFVVYLLPVVSLFFAGCVKKADEANCDEPRREPVKAFHKNIDYKTLIKLMLYYLLITFLVMVVSVNLPFLLDAYGVDSGVSGVVISLFFLSIMLPGFFLNRVLALTGKNPFKISLLLIGCGLLAICLSKALLVILVGVVLAGFGYGVAQPCLYDRTAALARGESVTYALALLMTMNYVAIVVTPVIIDSLQSLVGVDGERSAFVINAVISAVAIVSLLVRGFFVSKNR